MSDGLTDVNIGSGNGLVPSGSKPFPDPTQLFVPYMESQSHNELIGTGGMIVPFVEK